MVIKRIALFVFILQSLYSSGQNMAIGQWRTHQTFSNAVAVADAGNRIYCANSNGIFIYDKAEKSITQLGKEDGLSDIGITMMKYNKSLGILVIAYSNTNIDFIENNKIINFSDIKRSSITDLKKIYNIDFYGNLAYISCSFGIVVVDLAKKEVKDTYFIGSNGDHIQVNDIAVDPLNDSIYAATNTGIYGANLSSSNLVSFESWNKIANQPKKNATINCLAYFDKCLIANVALPTKNMDSAYILKNNTWLDFDTSYISHRSGMDIINNKLIINRGQFAAVFNSSDPADRLSISYWGLVKTQPQLSAALIDENGEQWAADNLIGLCHYSNWTWENIKVEGPPFIDATKIKMSGQTLWVAAGGKNDAWNNIWSHKGLYRFKNSKWTEYNGSTIAEMDTIIDIINLAITPNSDEHIYACSWGRGLIEINQNTVVNKFKETNSSLRNLQGLGNYYWLGTGGATFDKYGNLWVTNSSVTNELSVKRPNGSWQSFNLNSITGQAQISEIIIDTIGQKWIIMPRSNGLIVFNDKNTFDITSDDRAYKLSTAVGNGALPSTNILSIANDRDGKVWVGTDKGVCVFFNPEKIFTNENWDAQQILVEQDGYYQYLLEFEAVTSISVDGANRKWFGTQNAGVFLMSADGTKQLEHFTKENCPLLSNTIISTAINSETGEVFIATDKGISSYMGTSTKGKEEMTSLIVYPNPVKPGYIGPIAIRGLVTDANVKITDISGDLVYETTANGGEAIWNGCNMSGAKVNTGIYMVFCTNSDGSQTKVGKIMFER